MGVISGGSGGGGGGAVILRVNGLSGTSISATLGSKTVSGTIPTSGVLEMSLGKVGQWAVTASKSGYSFTQQVKAFTYGITEIWALAKKAFYDCTTTEIQAIVKSGMYKQYWAIGDYHKITLTTGEEIEVGIADFDHDIKTDGSKAPISLIMRNCFATKRILSAENKGWVNSDFRTSTLPSIISSFPSEWQTLMAPVQKKTANVYGSVTITETTDTAWIPSYIEIFGDSQNSRPGEGSGYPIFTDSASRIKTVSNVASKWWTRSFLWNDNNYKIAIGADGSYNNVYSNTQNGVCLGFAIG